MRLRTDSLIGRAFLVAAILGALAGCETKTRESALFDSYSDDWYAAVGFQPPYPVEKPRPPRRRARRPLSDPDLGRTPDIGPDWDADVDFEPSRIARFSLETAGQRAARMPEPDGATDLPATDLPTLSGDPGVVDGAIDEKRADAAPTVGQRRDPEVASAAAGVTLDDRVEANGPDTDQTVNPDASISSFADIVGIDERNLLRLFGTPSDIEEVPPALAMTFASPNCRLDVYLFMEMSTSELRVLSYDLKKEREGEHDDRFCISELTRSDAAGAS